MFYDCTIKILYSFFLGLQCLPNQHNAVSETAEKHMPLAGMNVPLLKVTLLCYEQGARNDSRPTTSSPAARIDTSCYVFISLFDQTALQANILLHALTVT